MGQFFERLKTALGIAPGGKQVFPDSNGKVTAMLPAMDKKSDEGILNSERHSWKSVKS
jgi:hypothetical protein